MVDIKPFRGWYFDEQKIGSISNVVAPPHDVISPIEQEELYKKSPYNVIRLILPKGDDHDSSCTALNEMLSKNVLLQDRKPAYYIYEQDFSHQGKMLRRFGFLALVRAEPFGKDVLPHEMVFHHKVEDRLKLLSKLCADMSPIFGLYKDDNSQIRESLWCLRGHSPLFEFTDEKKITHRLWPIYDNTGLARMFESKKIIVADGHHRYTAAAHFAQKSPDDDAKFVLMYLVGLDDPALVILPTHRLVSLPEFDVSAFLKKASKYFDIEEVKDIYELESQLLDADRHKFGMHTKEKSYLLELKDKSVVDQLAHKGHKKNLDVTLLQDFVLKKLLGADTDKLSFSKHPEDIKRMIDEDTHDVAFLMRNPEIDDVIRVVEEGDVMPHKSTYFYPKPLAGMVIRIMGK